MCIRDRRYPHRWPRRDDNVAIDAIDLKPHAGRIGHVRFDVCLLYTSDAADERSSVDLGGRRIIKKKNKVVTHEHHLQMNTQSKSLRT